MHSAMSHPVRAKSLIIVAYLPCQEVICLLASSRQGLFRALGSVAPSRSR